jgi:hypothetical protein
MKFLQFLTIIFLGSVSLLITSCVDNEGGPFPDLQDGVNMRIQFAPGASVVDPANVDNGKLTFNIYSQNDDLDKVELFLEYYNLEQDSTYQRTLLVTIPGSEIMNRDGVYEGYEITTQQIASALGISTSDMGGGDRFDLFNVTTLQDGRVYPSDVVVNDSTTIRNISPTIINQTATHSFTSQLTAYVACLPSNLGGTYSTVTTATSTDGCCPGEVTVESEVTFTQDGAISYALSDFSAGTYSFWYCNPYGLCDDTFGPLGAELIHVCNQVIINAGYWGSTGTGSIDPGTGVITINWINEFGDAGTTVYTPK